MKITAIICEYNPLTNGHVKHINYAKKETNCDAIFCIMSGSFTQRGEAAILDKYIRAALAVLNGADIVVELPTIFAVSPADNFAMGAMRIISLIPDITHLSFGSECGDIDKLNEVAKIIFEEPEEYKNKLREKLNEGLSFPKARAEAFKFYVNGQNLNKELISIIDAPNNILAISYINAARKLNLDIKFHTITRTNNYASENIEEQLPSALAIRNALYNNKKHLIKQNVPTNVYNALLQYKPRLFALGDIILFKIKSLEGKDFANYYDVTGGIHNRIKIAAENSSSYEELLEKSKNKNITLSRLKRICIYALLDITKELYNEVLDAPSYIQILAINKDMKDDLLSCMSNYTSNILTRYSDINRVDKKLRSSIKLDFTAQGVLNIANKNNKLARSMIIVER
ncbi:MAG TPA: nucleotidyltransferase family protein [Clostridiales bacterium]|nr:nucleotidyltransferase family protein [Clostridiales bacterium]